MSWSMILSWNSILDFVRVAVEFLLIAFVIYKVLYYLRGTRAVNVLVGLVLAFLVLYIIAKSLKLTVVSWLLDSFMNLMAFTIIVIFQPELRRAFAQLGSFKFFQGNRKRETINELVSAVNSMAGRRCGAIIVIERRIGMRAIVEDAIKLDCKLNNHLIQSIFYSNSPLHDGAVIVRDDRIIAARAILPLSRNATLSRTMGTRHRAALGITEETDAVVVVVSEETGDISIACRGEIRGGLAGSGLINELNKLLLNGGEASEALTDIL
ncbi:MAG: diadenylate cyclase CdaA, partial [Lentisphaeria bacterium]|nr:diadenylate cyclase CdaA [Lentisphaeria bacterium]